MCNVNQKSFVQKGHLNVHVKTHENVKSYVCSMCQKTFTTN
ncbi:hypothetical protein TSAR_006100 [Trichomalopsis sarcophagae]|uniref:C2H2-type domain-containing protein n=1 Tax=Trichomalopsis sarcophagae TaxID=543379 RepID=A0A232EGY1_9HYME|nr:hypothetical protein TSAR_006100 [Trichomalopsis sarcophagae]